MRAHDAVPGDAVAATPRHDEINNWNSRSLHRQCGPRHIREIIEEIIWQLSVSRAAERAKVQP